MRFSCIMPSYLGEYKFAAKHRDKKIVRAVKSVLNQSYQDFELLITADGCQQTIDIITREFPNAAKGKIKLLKIERHKSKKYLWSGRPRNAGLQRAEGEWMTYLDIDDMWGKDHLKIIDKGIRENPGYDWYWFNDRSYDVKAEQFNEHGCKIEVKGQCGTSNLCHKRDLAFWNLMDNYMQDWNFIQNLKDASQNYTKIDTPEYLICHCPGLLDV